MADVAQQIPDKGRTTATLWAASIGRATLTFNAIALITALAAIKAELDLSPTSLVWVINVYLLVAVALMVVIGRSADQYGHLRVFIFGTGIFVLGSLFMLAALDTIALVIGRALQGAGAAAVASTSLVLLGEVVPEEKRATTTALWGSMAALGMALGALIGGLLTAFIDWRVIFAVNVVLMGVALVMAVRILRAGGLGEQRQAGVKVDFLGLLLLMLCLGPLAYALTNGHGLGWGAPQIIIAVIVAASSGVLFVIVEQRSAHPLVNLEFFRIPRYCASALGMFITGINLYLFLVFYSLYVQTPDILSYSAMDSGASLLPVFLTMLVLSIIVPRVLAKRSFSWPIAVGMASAAICFWTLQSVSAHSSYLDIFWKLLLLGLALALAHPIIPRVGLRALPEGHAGQGAGVISASLYFGASIGVAVGNLVWSASMRRFLSGVIEKLPLTADERAQILHTLVHGSPSQIDAMLSHVATKASVHIGPSIQAAIENSFSNVMLMGSALAAVGVVLMPLLMRSRAT